MKAVVAAFNQEKALVGAFSVLTNLRMELFQALPPTTTTTRHPRAGSTLACFYILNGILLYFVAYTALNIYSDKMYLHEIIVLNIFGENKNTCCEDQHIK